MSKQDDLYLTMDDMSVIMFAGFAAFADVIEPEVIHRVLNTLARLADSPNRTPAAAEGIRQLVRFLEAGGHEEAEASASLPPQQEPAPHGQPLQFSRFRAIQSGLKESK